MSATATQKRPNSRLVVAVLKEDGKWFVEANPKVKDIPEGERVDLYDANGSRLVLPKGAIKVALTIIKNRRRNTKR